MRTSPEFIGGDTESLKNIVNEYKQRNLVPTQENRYIIRISSYELTRDGAYFDYVVITEEASLDSILDRLKQIADTGDSEASSILLAYYKNKFFEQYSFIVLDVIGPNENVNRALMRNSFAHEGAHYLES